MRSDDDLAAVADRDLIVSGKLEELIVNRDMPIRFADSQIKVNQRYFSIDEISSAGVQNCVNALKDRAESDGGPLGFYSSGTTRSSRSIKWRSAGSVLEEVQALGERIGRFVQNTTCIVLADICHSFGFCVGVLAVGGDVHRLYTVGMSNAFHMKNILNKVKPEVMVCGSGHARLLSEHIRRGGHFKRLTCIVFAGAPLSNEAAMVLCDRGIRMIQIYGTTETGAISINCELSPSSITDCGTPLSHLSVQVNQSGRFIVISGEERHVTDDEGELDAEGNLLVHGRVDRVVFVGGEKVDLDFVEEKVRSVVINRFIRMYIEKSFSGDTNLVCEVYADSVSQLKEMQRKLEQLLPGYARPILLSNHENC